MLRVLRLYLKVAIFQPELRECAPRTMFVLKSCDFPAGAAGVRILRLYLKVAICQPELQPELQEHAPRTTFVLKSCDFQAGAAADRGESNETAGLRKQARKPRDNFQRPFREQENRTVFSILSSFFFFRRSWGDALRAEIGPQVLCASALCKLLCASCSTQVALSKCCRSCGNVLRVLFFYQRKFNKKLP